MSSDENTGIVPDPMGAADAIAAPASGTNVLVPPQIASTQEIPDAHKRRPAFGTIIAVAIAVAAVVLLVSCLTNP